MPPLNLGLLAAVTCLLSIASLASASPVPPVEVPAQDLSAGPDVPGQSVATPGESVGPWCTALYQCTHITVTPNVNATVAGQGPVAVGTPAVVWPGACVPPGDMPFLCVGEVTLFPAVPITSTPDVPDTPVQQEVPNVSSVCGYADWALLAEPQALGFAGVDPACDSTRTVSPVPVADTPAARLAVRLVVAPGSYVDGHVLDLQHVGPQREDVPVPPVQAPNGSVLYEGATIPVTYCASGCDLPQDPDGSVHSFLEVTVKVGDQEWTRDYPLVNLDL